VFNKEQFLKYFSSDHKGALT